MSAPTYLELLADRDPFQCATFKKDAVVNHALPANLTLPVNSIRPVNLTVDAEGYEVPNANLDALKQGKNSFYAIDTSQTELEDECHAYDYIVDKDEKGMDRNAYEKLQKTDGVAGPPKLKPRPEQMRMVQEHPKTMAKINGGAGCKPCRRRLCLLMAVIIAASLMTVTGYVVYRKVNGLPLFGATSGSVTADTTTSVGSGFTSRFTTQTASRCSADFQYLQDASGCYKIVLESLNWRQSQARCPQLDPRAHLVVITSEQQNAAVVSYLASLNEAEIGACKYYFPGFSFHTSGQRLLQGNCSSPFVWKPNATAVIPLTYASWAPEEPNCNGYEDCLHYYSHLDYNWNDYPCSNKGCAVCQLDV